jgi:hypothetical protein
MASCLKEVGGVNNLGFDRHRLDDERSAVADPVG